MFLRSRERKLAIDGKIDLGIATADRRFIVSAMLTKLNRDSYSIGQAMIAKRKPELIFDGDFDEREERECRDRGYRRHVWVDLGKGERFPVVFYDAVRLRQDLDDETKSGHPFIAEPGLIVLPEVTRGNMEKSVCRLAEEGFFDAFRPASDNAAIVR